MLLCSSMINQISVLLQYVVSFDFVMFPVTANKVTMTRYIDSFFNLDFLEIIGS